MSIHISNSLVLAPSVPALQQNAGILAHNNVVTPGTVSATSELDANPATNLANPATAFTWEAGSTATQTITINTSGKAVNYIGIARHNLSQPGLTLEVRINGVPVIWPAAVSDAQALVYLIDPAQPDTVEIIIAGATTAPRIAVLYVGTTTRLQRNIYVGHTPITYGRDRTVINGLSESGQYLGEIVVKESLSTQVSLQNLTPEWYRAQLDPYFAEKPRRPCFWIWRPGEYPAEVGYCWVEGNPRPVNQRSNGMMQMAWTFRGIV